MTFRLKIRALEKNLFFGGSASAVGLYSASITYRIHGRIQSKSHEILETSRGRKKKSNWLTELILRLSMKEQTFT